MIRFCVLKKFVNIINHAKKVLLLDYHVAANICWWESMMRGWWSQTETKHVYVNMRHDTFADVFFLIHFLSSFEHERARTITRQVHEGEWNQSFSKSVAQFGAGGLSKTCVVVNLFYVNLDIVYTTITTVTKNNGPLKKRKRWAKVLDTALSAANVHHFMGNSKENLIRE